MTFLPDVAKHPLLVHVSAEGFFQRCPEALWQKCVWRGSLVSFRSNTIFVSVRISFLFLAVPHNQNTRRRGRIDARSKVEARTS